MTADARETTLTISPTNRAAIFERQGGPEEIQIRELETLQPHQLLPGEALFPSSPFRPPH
ncbi:hypothetical protein ACQY0O_005703 [Thecaphora frezii]